MAVTTNHPIHYPTRDGKPIAETFAHMYAILMTIEVLYRYLHGQQATVLGNQFLYYEEGNPKKRVAPDVFVIFDVEPGGRDNYKIWEEGSAPSITFEMTSPITQKEDEGSKKQLYAQIGVQEYWQFDPKGEWIKEQLRGYRLENGQYQSITNNISQVLQLRLAVDNSLINSPTPLISFYQLDNGEKLLLPAEMQARIMVAQQEAASAQQKSLELAAQLAAYQARFGTLDS